MPGRKDFGILLSSALTDPRIRTAARFYVAKKLATKPTAVYAVFGHIAVLGMHLARDTDDGILRGPIVDALSVYLAGASESEAERIADILSDPSVGLLRPCVGGHYLAGFADAYAPYIRAREAARERGARNRSLTPKIAPPEHPNPTISEPEKTDLVPRCSPAAPSLLPGCSEVAPMLTNPLFSQSGSIDPDSSPNLRRTFAKRVEESRDKDSPPPPADGGRGSLRSPDGDGPDDGAGTGPPTHNPQPTKPLRPRARELLARKLDYLAETGTIAERSRAVAIRKLNRAEPLPDHEVRNLLDSLRWITPERLARHRSDSGHRKRKRETRDGEHPAFG